MRVTQGAEVTQRVPNAAYADAGSALLCGTRAFARTQRCASAERASRATIAFLESDRPDAPRAGDAYGDGPGVSWWRRRPIAPPRLR
jgi:hypothetical protein